MEFERNLIRCGRPLMPHSSRHAGHQGRKLRKQIKKRSYMHNTKDIQRYSRHAAADFPFRMSTVHMYTTKEQTREFKTNLIFPAWSLKSGAFPDDTVYAANVDISASR